MRSFTSAAMAALLLVGLPTVAWSHHSAVQYDFQNPVEVSGVVRQFRVANPHTHLLLEVTDDNGTREIEFEGHSRNNVYRSGWRDGMVERGDTVTIRIAPLRTGEDGGYILGFILEDGTEF